MSCPRVPATDRQLLFARCCCWCTLLLFANKKTQPKKYPHRTSGFGRGRWPLCQCGLAQWVFNSISAGGIPEFSLRKRLFETCQRRARMEPRENKKTSQPSKLRLTLSNPTSNTTSSRKPNPNRPNSSTQKSIRSFASRNLVCLDSDFRVRGKEC